MKIHSINIKVGDFPITGYIGAKQFIVCQICFAPEIQICFIYIDISNITVAVDVSLEVDLHVLGHGFRAYRDGVLPGDMLALDDLHGVGAGRNIGE